MRRPWLVTLGALSAVVLAPPAGAAEVPVDRLERQIERVLDLWHVPGAAVVVVSGGDTVLARGFGVAEVDTPTPVAADTLFSIGSCTKAFTAATLATVIEEGGLAWDDPVIDYLPDFAMPDPADSSRVTVRDLLAHRTGLTGGDLISWGATFSRREIVARIPDLEQTSPLRSEFHYNNNVYVAAGEILPAVTGDSWNDAVAVRLIRPLGMNHTVTSLRSITPQAARASPHAVVDGMLRPIPPMNEDNCAAAGAIWSTADDMTHWIRMLLDGGRWRGEIVLATESIDEMWQVQMPQRTEPDRSLPSPANPKFAGYGLGWELRDYRGRKMIRHGGQSDGMVAQVTLIPEEALGVVILLNRHATDAHRPIELLVVDTLLGVDPPVDWIRAFQDTAPGTEAIGDTPTGTPADPSDHPSWFGRYEQRAVGAASIRADGDRIVLELDRAPLYGGVIARTDDGFEVVRAYPLVDPSPIRFHREPDGSISGFTLEPDPTDWLATRAYKFNRLDSDGPPRLADTGGG